MSPPILTIVPLVFSSADSAAFTHRNAPSSETAITSRHSSSLVPAKKKRAPLRRASSSRWYVPSLLTRSVSIGDARYRGGEAGLASAPASIRS